MYEILEGEMMINWVKYKYKATPCVDNKELLSLSREFSSEGWVGVSSECLEVDGVKSRHSASQCNG